MNKKSFSLSNDEPQGGKLRPDKHMSRGALYRQYIKRDWESVTRSIRGSRGMSQGTSHYTSSVADAPVMAGDSIGALLNAKRAKTRSASKYRGWFWPIVGGIGMIGMGGAFLWMANLSIPSLTTFNERKSSNSTTIYDRTGEIILYDVVESAERTTVASEKISPWMKKAAIAAEDDQFYQHKGVRIDSTIRGATNTALEKLGFPVSGSGGSTITQQVLKNTILTSDHAVTRKIKEWILATKLEQQYTKDQILTMYLNEVPFGGNIYGVEAAARHFFGSNATDLTITQSAYLAAIVNRPSYLSPYGKHLDALENRKNYVLKQMLNNNLISPTEYATARAEKVVWIDKKDNKSKAIHFVEYIREKIEQQYGAEAMTSGGFKVITTIDWDIQQVAEEAAKTRTADAERDWNASNSGVVVVQPGTGDILAMVGSRDYEDPNIDGMYNVTLAKRQPGSSFKPIIYAAAFEIGYTPETVLFDVATQFGTGCGPSDMRTTTDGKCYSPGNYDGIFKGPISLRNALAQSRNIPAVKLLYLVTPNRALQLAKTLGMQSLGSTGLYGLSLVLGGGEVRLLDMTGAYAAFGNDGKYAAPHGILSIESKADGKVIYQHKPVIQQALSVDAARNLSSVLSDPVARAPLSGGQLNGFGVPVAAKTGTTNNNRDAWLLGYTPDVAVGVWFGNNDNTPMKKGSSIAIPLFRDVMAAALAEVPSKKYFGSPAPINPNLPPVLRGYWYGNEAFTIDTVSGKLATDATPVEARKEYIVPTPHTILAFVQPGNPMGGPGSNTSHMYTNWEYGVQKWVEKNADKLPPPPIPKPTEYDDVHIPENEPTITIPYGDPAGSPATPPEQQIVTVPANTDYLLGYSAVAKYPWLYIRVYIDDELVAESDQVTGTISFPTPGNPGTYELRVVVSDSIWNKGQMVRQLRVQ